MKLTSHVGQSSSHRSQGVLLLKVSSCDKTLRKKAGTAHRTSIPTKSTRAMIVRMKRAKEVRPILGQRIS